MAKRLRVALFSDSFYELNGVGTVSREFAKFAERHDLPFCRVHSGAQTRVMRAGGGVQVELKRGLTFPLDQGLYCDPFLSRYRNFVLKQVGDFRPDLIHITGPGDMGVLGFWISHILGVPMAASWHTNLHEYASRRLSRTVGERGAAVAESLSLRALVAFYRLAHFVIAPNQAMVDVLAARTRRPAYRMKHGVDAARFSLSRRTANGKFCVGWVGRLTPEKNVRVFAELERQLLAAGERDFEMLLVGDGSERGWLREHMRSATMPGFLHGDALVNAFGAMDAFVFPSGTDTFGLVILEAMASGVPVVLSSEAGQRVGMRDGVEGILCENFAQGVLSLMRGKEMRERISRASEEFARAQTWDDVFEELYGTYEAALERPEVRRRMKPAGESCGSTG